MCPWCYIGKRRLEAAMEAGAEKYDFRVHWLPYQLWRSLGSEGVDRRQQYGRFYGERLEQKMGALYDEANAVGVDLTAFLQPGGVMANTFQAHRLIHYATAFKKQNEVVDLLFEAYFQEGANLASTEVLARAASEAGMDGAAARRYLESDENAEEIRNAVAVTRKLAPGVPFFVFNQRFSFSGVQEVQVFLRAFQRTQEEAKAPVEAFSGSDLLPCNAAASALKHDSVSDVVAGSLALARDADELAGQEAVVARDRVRALDPRQLRLVHRVLGHDARSLLVGEELVLGHELVVRDVDDELVVVESSVRVPWASRFSTLFFTAGETLFCTTTIALRIFMLSISSTSSLWADLPSLGAPGKNTAMRSAGSSSVDTMLNTLPRLTTSDP
eukprot:CAMPEP_0114612792 /NCGR_PEP_ID=MMETSP0168-20121206/4801_1 /TAXON_ID=95228 ORGANISM="Vannella sp., Strain DIVA3 517/6/12" /NCGR_SAMPLE_ID=MMETSP0168 /ASSEMBLY_ACC=CAM_ASM_000044 /LENGTH=385 /DNA_ID=CAMNT_0001823781 /DNA_START=83 /DNA_END=1242 /DNA_ORIENTATION=+